jgi:hypothetical protein
MLSKKWHLIKHLRLLGMTPVRTHTWRLYAWSPVVRLPALMELYIHPLYVLVSKIFSSILNSPAPIHPLYILYPLWDPLVTLSKYIHVWFSFEGFIETNLTVKSKFNLDFWFVSYNIFYYGKKWVPSLSYISSLLSLACTLFHLPHMHSPYVRYPSFIALRIPHARS